MNTAEQYDAHIVNYYARHNKAGKPHNDNTVGSFQNIPQELKDLNSWICWKLVPRAGVKPTKLPVNARTGALADVTNPNDYSSFDVAVVASTKYCGIGLCFTPNDDYCGIDLDDTHGDAEAYARQIKIFEQFNSYSELSPSGKGLHIIIKARLPGGGRRRASIEFYDRDRYFTFTGNVHLSAPIAERQELADLLYQQLGGTAKAELFYEDEPEREGDYAILNRAGNAVNGPKFKTLYAGNWIELYSSQSEADLALVNIIAFYTKNRPQISRLFRKSELGQRDKAKRDDYVASMIEKALGGKVSYPAGTLGFAENPFNVGASNDGVNRGFKSNVFSFGEFTKDCEAPFYIWHHVLQRGYLYSLTGMWGGGKTAIAITIAVHAARGLVLCGNRMVAAKVLILCGENPDDVRLRVVAACATFGIDPTTLERQICFTRLPFAIDDLAARASFIEDALRVGKVDLLIVDTGPAHSSADDENSNRQMHVLAMALRELMIGLGNPATIVLMHPPKGATRETVGTSRGGGAFSGSVDGQLGVWRHENDAIEFFHSTKFRGPGFQPMYFDLKRHEFTDIVDNFGEPAISVVAVPTNAKPKAKAKLTGSNRIALNALGECRHSAIAPPQGLLDGLSKCGGQPLGPPFAVTPVALWRERCYQKGIADGEQSAKAAAFRRSRKALLDLGLIHTLADHYWMPEWCTAGKDELLQKKELPDA